MERSESCWGGRTYMLNAFCLCLDLATVQGQVFLYARSPYPSHCLVCGWDDIVDAASRLVARFDNLTSRWSQATFATHVC